VQPVRALAEIAHAAGALFHTDAVQALGKIPLDVETTGADLLSVSAHKIFGPKGVGALYVRKGVALAPLVDGGGHENGLRSGTENVPGIAAFGKAAEAVPALLESMPAVEALRDRLETGILGLVEGARVNGCPDARLPNTLNVTLPGFRGESLVLEMSRRGVYFSSGSACQSGHPGPSRALLAMGLSEADAHCALRFSLGPQTTQEDVERTLVLLKEVMETSKSTIHFFPCR
jgi:cysteine sulfinate desulfinase/cysteine desulfurase-like protein